MKISSCIDMMFSYCDFYDRFSEAKGCGINIVEFWKWSNKDVNRIAEIANKNEQTISIFNLDSKDDELSYKLSRGLLNDGSKAEFMQALEESLPVYKKLRASAMIVLIGEHSEYNPENITNILRAVKPVIERENVTLIIEPLNNIDRIGYTMPYATPVFELVKSINSPNIKMLYDIYHQSMMGDFSIDEIKRNIDIIGHFHVADAPGRHEPGTGKVDYINILKEINKLSYSGYVGLEYRALKDEKTALGFLKEVMYV